MSKFLVFKKEDTPLEEYSVEDNKEDTIGHIFFYKPWKKWVFESAYDVIICDAKCLRDIAEFLEKLK